MSLTNLVNSLLSEVTHLGPLGPVMADWKVRGWPLESRLSGVHSTATLAAVWRAASRAAERAARAVVSGGWSAGGRFRGVSVVGTPAEAGAGSGGGELGQRKGRGCLGGDTR